MHLVGKIKILEGEMKTNKADIDKDIKDMEAR